MIDDAIRQPYGQLSALYGHHPQVGAEIAAARRRLMLEREESRLMATAPEKLRQWRRDLGSMDKALMRPRPASGRIRL